MTDKGFIAPSAEYVSIRLMFIYKLHGLEAAETYFDNIHQQHKTLLAYKSLLSCHCHSKSIEKAESLMREIRYLGYNKTSVCYTKLMKLYYRLRDYEKLDLLVQEMEQNNIVLDNSVYTIQLSAYAAASDSDRVDKIVKKMESDPCVFMDTNVYSTIASAYLKLGLHEKTLEILRKSEKVLLTTQSTVDSTKYDFLIEFYGRLGKKDDVFRIWNLHVFRIWNLHKKVHNILNKSHICMLKTLVRLNEIEEVVKIVKEWELNARTYDFKIANFLIKVYCESGETKKAEDVINNGIANGAKPMCQTWLMLAGAYIKDNQFAKLSEHLRMQIRFVEMIGKMGRI
jgi:pentatricopeptide repeat protein